MIIRRVLVLGIVAVMAATARDGGAAPACPEPAAVTVFVNNLSGDAALTLTVDGELRDANATCAGAGDAAYATTVECTGTGVFRCGTIAGLRPGAWVNRLRVTVSGSSPQAQTSRTVILGGSAPGISNVMVWTVYPRTFVVRTAEEADLRQTLDAAGTFTRESHATALVTFDPDTFPDAATPTVISLTPGTCDSDHRRAALCLGGSGIVVDALDRKGNRGAVVLSVASRASPLLRLYGSDDVLRGLVFEGSSDSTLTVQADTVAIVGPTARRNRLEQCIVRGPAKGDAVSVTTGAGQSVDGAPSDIVIDDCELTGAYDKGLKITTGGRATVRASCVHDNRNGGMQATLGGTLTAIGNLVQHNVPGSSQSGIAGGAAGDGGARNTVVTQGNIVRFSGARGVTVIDAADASFRDDFVADNQFSGARVDATTHTGAPTASFGGVAFICNHNGGITGTCRSAAGDDGALCTTDADCCGTGTCCVSDPGCSAPVRCVPPAPQGFGAVIASCAGCTAPEADFGTASAPGQNAFALNVNSYPNARGANLSQSVPGLAVAAGGDQWEHCGADATCDAAAVSANDVQLAAGATVDLNTPQAPRAGVPEVLGVSVARPRAGDLVRIFGRNFNAVDGAACAQSTAPVAPCSSENPRLAQANKSGRFGNRVVLTIGGQPYNVDLDAATPTMLAFRMPIDCFAPATVAVSKRDPAEKFHGATVPFCDAGGCQDAAAGAPCDDRNVCTVADTCSDDGRCVAGPPLDCGGPCMRCDPVLGCVPLAADAACDDGNACTVGDHCRGDAGVCVPGTARPCAGACLTGICDPGRGCVPRDVGAACDDGNACTAGDHCRGDADVCVPGNPKSCAGQCLTGSCDPTRGCRLKAVAAPCSDGNACTTGDHCRGDADVCVPGTATDCDDGDPCTIESCGATLGCVHDPVAGFDAVSCRFDRSTRAINRSLDAQSRVARLLDAVFARLQARLAAARAARASSQIRKARRDLDAVARRLTALSKRLPYHSMLSAALADELVASIAEARDAAVRLRDEL